MKTIGIIGGMSWRSSLEYYKIINETISDELGGRHSAKIIMYSVDFDEIDVEHNTDKWLNSDKILIEAAKKLENSGADFIVIAANTVHALAGEIQKNIHIPILHIADVTANKIKSKGIKKVGLLGTKYTMTKDFYKSKLDEHQLEAIIPSQDEIEIVNNEINKLCCNKDDFSTKDKFIKIINNLIKKGAEGIILGCTEIPLVIKQEDISVPIFNTTFIHAESAAKHSLK